VTLAEGVQLVSFGILTVTLLGAALGVVLFNNIVYSAFLLGGVFISVSGLYLLLNASFVAAAQILIYVGAINVLIVYAIMLVNKKQDFAPLPNLWLRRGVTAAVCLGLFLLLSTTILSTSWPTSTAIAAGDDATVLIGKHFFSDFLLPFELASVLLLMAMIGAIVLARKEFIPDALPGEAITTGFTLPERAKEAAVLTASNPK
jgi:NAD(P)H-quinone oxidoreductase subunit 6